MTSPIRLTAVPSSEPAIARAPGVRRLGTADDLLETCVHLLAEAEPSREAVLDAVRLTLATTGGPAALITDPDHLIRLKDSPSELIWLDDSAALSMVSSGDGLVRSVRSLAEVARMAIRAAVLAASASAGLAEVESMRTVATRILASRGLDEALSGVTHETLALLRADIAGVMLRDGEEIVMRGCAGNRRVDTSRLRMRRHQGLAGLVFATGRPVKVDDYLNSSDISGDFRRLAVEEETRSAMGAPLVVDDQVIGVLEVWRRGPDPFNESDTLRLVALADLAAIAFQNARLNEANQTNLREVELANRALAAQYGKARAALNLQQDLVQSLVDGERLNGLIRLVAQRSDCAVQYFDNDLQDLGHFPPGHDSAELTALIESVISAGHGQQGTRWLALGTSNVALRDVRVGTDRVGWLCLVTRAERGDQAVGLAAIQASLSCSLHHLQEQAAVKARATMREDMLLNLLRGTSDERRAAVARAKYLNVDLKGDLRVCVCALKNLDEIAQANGWSAASIDSLRRGLLVGCESVLSASNLVRLAAVQGDALVLLTRSRTPDELRELLARCSDSLRTEVPGLTPMWGASSATSSTLELSQALEEAWTAASVAGQTPARSVAIFEELGILGLLLSGADGTNMLRFIEQTIGPVREHDRDHGSQLLDTLRAYLDCQCSQQDAAAALFVHQKTVKYRLGAIEKLTGLNLREHRDRMRADVAVRAADLI